MRFEGHNVEKTLIKQHQIFVYIPTIEYNDLNYLRISRENYGFQGSGRELLTTGD